MISKQKKRCILLINTGHQAKFDLAISFIKSQGRMKYIRPIYRALFKDTYGKEMAIKTFNEVRNQYHPIAAKMVAKDLQLQ